MLLPGAFYTLRETQLPPLDLLRKYKVPIALATDCNPGSSPLASLAADHEHGLHLVPDDAGGGTWQGVTREAASALGLSGLGTLEAGKTRRSGIWNIATRRSSPTGSASTLEKRLFGGTE